MDKLFLPNAIVLKRNEANVKKLLVSYPLAQLKKNSQKLPAGTNFFFAISLPKMIYKKENLKRYAADLIKMLLCIDLYLIFMLNFYVDSSKFGNDD